MNKDPLAEKLPTFGQFKLNPIHAVAYVLLLYFVYKEFTENNRCKELETIVVEYKSIIDKQDQRILVLEKYIDIKNGVIMEVTERLESKGGSK